MKNVKVLPYDIKSASAGALAEALECRRVNKNNTKLKGSSNITLVNWGNSILNSTELNKCTILNNPTAVGITANKFKFFELFKKSPDFLSIIPDYATNTSKVNDWFVQDNKTIVVARTILNGHSGEGIKIFNLSDAEDNGFPRAPLYTKYIPKKEEYRVHFSRKTGIFFKQRKAMVHGTEKPNWKIRNLAGGFIYANQDVETPKVVDNVAEMFYNGLEAGGLDFGALDIIYNERTDRAYILEVNTAPGLSGRTLEAYKDMLKVYLP